MSGGGLPAEGPHDVGKPKGIMQLHTICELYDAPTYWQVEARSSLLGQLNGGFANLGDEQLDVPAAFAHHGLAARRIDKVLLVIQG